MTPSLARSLSPLTKNLHFEFRSAFDLDPVDVAISLSHDKWELEMVAGYDRRKRFPGYHSSADLHHLLMDEIRTLGEDLVRNLPVASVELSADQDCVRAVYHVAFGYSDDRGHAMDALTQNISVLQSE